MLLHLLRLSEHGVEELTIGCLYADRTIKGKTRIAIKLRRILLTRKEEISALVNSGLERPDLVRQAIVSTRFSLQLG